MEDIEIIKNIMSDLKEETTSIDIDQEVNPIYVGNGMYLDLNTDTYLTTEEKENLTKKKGKENNNLTFLQH